VADLPERPGTEGPERRGPYERRTSPRADRLAAPLATLLAGGCCALVAGLQLGGVGVLSAALGTALVAAFFWSGLLPLLLAHAAGDRAGAALLVLLVNYALRLVLLLVVLTVAARSGAVDDGAVGLTVVVCALVWTGVHAARLGRVSST
jgi:hypothetical protein